MIIIGSITLLFSACSHKTPLSPNPKPVSVTILPKGKAPLLKSLNKTNKKLANKSAFYPLNQPTDAFAARLFQIDNATTSLDVQYYIYEDDRIGKVFTAHLLLAAQRGVKVRILVDDMITSGRDEEWEKLTLHPNIELRLFNPNRLRTSFRNIALLLDVNRLGRRMHNKALIADGSAAIIGGRNIGNVYFASSKETLFLDYDVLVIGKVLPDIYEEFDIYWNSKEAVPSKEVFAYDDPKLSLALKKDLENELKAFRTSAIGKAIINSEFNKKMIHNNLTLIVAKRTDFYYDLPSKVNTDENDDLTHISSQISEDLKYIKDDLVIISPYFIPSDEMMVRLKEARNKGVEVTIVTNSLASTDVLLVYGAYKDSIKELVEIGGWLASEGEVMKAIEAYAEAQKLDPAQQISARSWDILCWYGSLLGYAAEVMDACEQAVALDPENWLVLDSRGIARALTGNIDGAIEDFQAFISGTENKEERDQRQRWIKALQAGENPFTDEEIDALLN